MNISFIGLGKLGLPLATNFAKNGHKVIGIDLNLQLLKLLNENIAPWHEEQLQDNIINSKDTISYTNNYDEIINTDVTIILVNTPSNKADGSFSNLYVEQSLLEVSKRLKLANKKNHLFILSSTVMPTSINNTFIPLIENCTGWEINKDFGFAYIPDFVAIGQIIKDFENPDFLLIGESSDAYGNIAKKLYFDIIKNDAKFFKMSLLEAEIAKVTLNAYITTKISFANYLGLLCEKIDARINVDSITNAIGNDKRIGSKYFKAGTSYGGTCFPRDTWAFMKLSSNFGMVSYQMEANEKINNLVDEELFIKIIKSGYNKIGLVGLSFKPGTAVVTEGLAIKLTRLMKNRNYDIFVYDELLATYDNYKNESNENFTICNNLEDVYESAEVIVICNNNKNYVINKTNKFIIDPWHLVN
ncbi:MAG: nucleotide sugar dehydrogenase [Candidatus Kapaibacteriota bacterium]